MNWLNQWLMMDAWERIKNYKKVTKACCVPCCIPPRNSKFITGGRHNLGWEPPPGIQKQGRQLSPTVDRFPAKLKEQGKNVYRNCIIFIEESEWLYNYIEDVMEQMKIQYKKVKKGQRFIIWSTYCFNSCWEKNGKYIYQKYIQCAFSGGIFLRKMLV